jgi:hypothetical protein
MEDGRRRGKAVAGWSRLRQSAKAFAGPLTSHRVLTEDRWWAWLLALLAQSDDERCCVGQITSVSHGTSRASPKAATGAKQGLRRIPPGGSITPRTEQS